MNILSELKKDPVEYIRAVNELLSRINKGLLTQDLTQFEIELFIDRFGENWFKTLGYNQSTQHKEPIFTIPK